MPIVNSGVTAETQEASIHPQGTALVRCFSSTLKTSKSNADRQLVSLGCEILSDDEDDYQPIFHNLLIPTEAEKNAKYGVDEEQDKLFNNNKRFALDVKRACVAFGVPLDNDGLFDSDHFLGMEATLTLRVGEYQGEPKNELVLPRIN